MRNDHIKDKVVAALNIPVGSSWYEIGKEIEFLADLEKFDDGVGCNVSGAIRILCKDFDVESPEHYGVSEKQALENLLQVVEQRAADRAPHVYAMGINSQTYWSQGQWVDFRNTISKIIELFDDKQDSVDLSVSDKKKLYRLLWETPANRKHCKF